MNKLCKNIIEIIYKYSDKKTNNSLRTCSKYLSKTIGHLYFSELKFRIIRIPNKDKYKFRHFVHKYNILLNIGVHYHSQLAYIKTFNINSLTIHNTSFDYIEYFVPKTLKHLYSSSSHDCFLKPKLNINLRSLLSLSIWCKENINIYPSTLTNLDLVLLNDQPINTLPSTLKILKLRGSFNQPVTLPTTLTHLELGYVFNQPITLPTSLTYLEFGFHFNKNVELDKIFNLKTLIFGSHFNSNVKLPSSLTCLKFGFGFNKTIETFPSNLQKLHIGSDIETNISLPSSITKLHWNYFNNPKKMPPSLKYLTFGYCYDGRANIIKSNVEILKINASTFNYKISVLPYSLRKLIFCYNSEFNKKIELYVLPKNLEVLVFGKAYNKPFEHGVLPVNLKELVFCEESKFNQVLSNTLPNRLEKLIFGKIFNIFSWDILPLSLTFLRISKTILSKDNIPSMFKDVEIELL